jgi:hypothetical protein
MSKQKAVEAVGGKIYIQQIDAEGKPIEEWALFNPWIKAVNFDELDYESDDIVNLEVTLRYDWAELTQVGGAKQRVSKNIGKPGAFRPGSGGSFGTG